MTNLKKEHLECFIELTERRIFILQDKKLKNSLTRAEDYELDMCLADIAKAKKELSTEEEAVLLHKLEVETRYLDCKCEDCKDE